METPQVIAIRDFLKSITHVNKNDNKERQLPLIIMIDNEHSMEELIHPVIWDDTNERLWYWAYNNTASTSVMVGTDRVLNSAILTGVNYEQIQQIRAVIDEEAHNKYCEKFIEQGLLTKEQQNIIAGKFFRRTNTEYDNNYKIPITQTNYPIKY